MTTTTISDPRIRVVSAIDTRREDGKPQTPNPVLAFIGELRRRRVCRTITTYSLALWLVCQIVDVVSAPLGLPVWTLKFIIVIGLIGFPIALILSWLFQVTNEGVVPDASSATHAAPRRPTEWAVDCTLLLAAMIISVQLATGFLSATADAAPPVTYRIAVLPFRATVGEGVEAVTYNLVGELQHELTVAPRATVIAADEKHLSDDSYSLTGTVSVAAGKMRTRVVLIENDTGEITWSDVFEVASADHVEAPAFVAREIVDALPLTSEPAIPAEGDHES